MAKKPTTSLTRYNDRVIARPIPTRLPPLDDGGRITEREEVYVGIALRVIGLGLSALGSALFQEGSGRKRRR